MADRLAQCVVEALHGSGANRLVLVGGDTAMQVLARLGVGRLEVRGEIQPGMPLVTGDDAGGFARVVVLKAGNHGTEEARGDRSRIDVGLTGAAWQPRLPAQCPD